MQVIGLVLKYQSSIIFQFRLFPGKTNEIFFSKNSQNPIIRPFSAFFAQILTEMNFSGKKGLYHFLNTPVIYHCAKNPKKIMTHSLNSLTDRQIFFWKKGLCQLLNTPVIYHRAKNPKQIMIHSWYRQTDKLFSEKMGVKKKKKERKKKHYNKIKKPIKFNINYGKKDTS